MVVLKVVDREFPPVNCLLIVPLILVDEFEVSLNCNMCSPVSFQFSLHGKCSHIVDSTIDLIC